MNTAVETLKPKTAEKGLVARFLRYMIDNKPDTLFGVIRNVRPNLSLPGADGPVFITRFADVREALERPEIFNVVYGPMMDPSVGPFMLGRDNSKINQRDKGIMRSLMQEDDLPEIRKTVSRLAKAAIAPHLDKRQIDVVKHVSRHVPLQLTGEYFGFPGPDIDTMLRWSFTTQHDMFHNADRDRQVHEANCQSGREMKVYLNNWIPQRREDISNDSELDDILCRLLRLNTPHEIGFGEDRIATNIMGTLVGGGETTSQAIVQILQQLCMRPKVLQGAIEAAKADDNDLLFTYCWEALRLDPINPFVVRRCAKEYKIASGSFRSSKIKAGKTVLISTRSAMKDGREVPAPRSFCIDRPGYHYLHMGYGLHTCLGDQVSRAQVPEIVKQLLQLPGVRQLSPISKTGSLHLNEGVESPFPESFILEFDNFPETIGGYGAGVG